MNIKIFMNSANSNLERSILRSFGVGVSNYYQFTSNPLPIETQYRIGRWTTSTRPSNSVDFEYTEGYVPCDVAVFFGSWKPREKGHHVTRNSIAYNAKKFICIETPLLNRSTIDTNQYWRVGINGFLNQDAVWPIVPKTMLTERLKNFGVHWQGWNNDQDGHVLVALQLPGDASLRGADINAWALDVVNTVRSKTQRPIVIRSHPLASVRAFEDHWELAKKIMFNKIQNVSFSDGAERTWAKDLEGAYCTVTYSSGLAVDSIIAGIPTVACDPGNFAWAFSTRFVDEIEDIQMPGADVVVPWLEHLSGIQWSQQEMRLGQTWQYLIPAFESMQ